MTVIGRAVDDDIDADIEAELQAARVVSARDALDRRRWRLERVGPSRRSSAELSREGGGLALRAEIAPRAYHRLRVVAGEDRRDRARTDPFALIDLEQLRDQLDALAAWRALLRIDGATLHLHVDELRARGAQRATARPVVALFIKVWRMLRPMFEGEAPAAQRRREQREQRQQQPVGAPRRVRGDAAEPALAALADRLAAALAPVGAVVERTGHNSFEGRALDEDGAPLLRALVGFATARAAVVHLDLKLIARLPCDTELHLVPRGAVSSWFRRAWAAVSDDADELERHFDIDATGAAPTVHDVHRDQLVTSLIDAARPVLVRLGASKSEVRLMRGHLHVATRELRGVGALDVPLRDALVLWQLWRAHAFRTEQ